MRFRFAGRFTTRRCLALTISFGALLWMLTGCATLPMQPVSPPPEVLAGSLIGKTWSVQEVRIDNETQNFAFVAPVTISFNDVGGVRITAARCWSGGYDVYFQSEQTFRLGDTPAFAAVPCGDMASGTDGPTICATIVGPDATLEDCAVEIERQSSVPTKAFRATTHFAVDGDRLTLSGDNVEMHLVLQSP